MTSELRIHLGCGKVIHPGWVNIDIKPYPGVDRVLDIRQGLPFDNVRYIYAEHFIEHFTSREGQQFLLDCRQSLSPTGVLRLTTPNLDWVWATSYRTRWTAQSNTTASINVLTWGHEAAAAEDCLALNRAFYCWGHRFLYNRAMLHYSLQRAGFAHCSWLSYGISPHAALRGLERHEKSQDTEALPHVLVVEASGHTDERRDPTLLERINEFERDSAID